MTLHPATIPRSSRSGRLDLLGPFSVPGLEASRLVRVYVPSSVLERDRRGVLVMYDGQNMFEDGPSFAGGWHLDRIVERLSRRGLKAPVIVGVDHGGVHRLDELCPFKWGQSKGQADILVDWLVDTLMPGLRRRYILDARPEANVIGGSSMGGLCSIYTHFRRPDCFGGAFAMSSALWFAGKRIFGDIAARPAPRVSRIYLDAGALEGHGGVLALTERLALDLRRRGYGTDRLLFRADPRGEHREAHWRRRVPQALRFLFGRPRTRQR